MKRFVLLLMVGILLLPILLFAQLPSISRYCIIPTDSGSSALCGMPDNANSEFWVSTGIRMRWYTHSCATHIEVGTDHFWNDLCYAGKYHTSSSYYYRLFGAGSYLSGDDIYAAASIKFRQYSSNYYYEGISYCYGSNQPFPTHPKKGLVVWHYGSVTSSNYQYNAWCAYQDLEPSNRKTYLTWASGNSNSFWYYYDLGSSDTIVTDMYGPTGRLWGPIFITGYDSSTGDGFLRGFYGYNGGVYGIWADSSATISGAKAWAVKLVRDTRDGIYHLFIAAGSKGLLVYKVTTDIFTGTDYSAGFNLEPVAQWKPEGETVDIRDVYVYRTNDGNYWALLANYAPTLSDPLIIGIDWYNLSAINEWARVTMDGKMGKRLWVNETNKRIAIISDNPTE